MKAAQKRGVTVISITDHNVIKNSLKAYRLAEEFGLIVIPGIEFLFKVGRKYYEVLAYFVTATDLKRFYRSVMSVKETVPVFNNGDEVIERIKKFGGVVVAPHLFSYKGFFRDGEKGAVHGIEEINAHKGKKQTQLSREFAKERDYIGFGGGDIHLYRSSLDKIYTRLESEEPITYSRIWKNLKKEETSIDFIPCGNYMPFTKIYFEKIILGFVVAIFLVRQWIPYLKRRIQYFKSV